MYFDSVNKFKDVDIPELASFMFEATKDTVFHREGLTREYLEEAFKRRVNNENALVLIATAEGKIVGVLRIFTGFPEIVLAGNWHPRIHSGDKREEIAMEMIQFCKEYVKENGFKRFEMNLIPIKPEHAEVYREYKSWCEKSGLYRTTEEVFLQVDIQNHQLPSAQPSLPEGFRFESIDNVTNDEIESPVLDSFSVESDRAFVDLTSSQQKTVFNYWFRRSQPFHRSTILVMKDDEVVGFNVVRVNDDSAHIGPTGIIPNYQRHGIMKAVLHESFRRLQEQEQRCSNWSVHKVWF
ncbi:MAG: GNAT family N-acetyltransferase [Candidatus Thorarchaeota archaeon]|jgi:ribosomal protein S18 acetylase RimI-like enzyme